MFRLAVAASAFLVVGCLAEQDPFDRQTMTRSSDDLPGIAVKGTVERDGHSHRLGATATNQGPHSYQVRSVCDSPWSMRWRDQGATYFEPTEPQAKCQGFAFVEFPPNATLSMEAWWNETRWDPEEERVVGAENGFYTWEVAFRANRTGFPQAHDITLSFLIQLKDERTGENAAFAVGFPKP